MSQHDYIIDNQDGASFRGDINAALAAIVSQNSGLTEPAGPYAYMLWMDTTTGILKQRNAANNAWVALVDAIAAAPLSRLLTTSTAQATTSGTTKDFTGIPSWVKRITVLMNGISNVSGLGSPLIQIGSGSFDTTGYNSAGSYSVGTNNVGSLAATNGFLAGVALAASTVFNGVLVLNHMGGNVWMATGTGCASGLSGTYANSGTKTLSGTLDRLRFTMHTADTFDAGSVNILYE
jgi:hypothetical protein